MSRLFVYKHLIHVMVDQWVRSDLQEVIRQRAIAAMKAAADTDLQLQIKHLCSIKPEFFISDWCWTSDPRNVSRGVSVTVPFILYPRQVEYLHWRRQCVANRQFGLHGKSRDSGASWINAADQIHHWLFTPQFKGGFGSNKEMKVDRKGDPDSIFSKLRFLLKMLPDWMLPDSYQDNYLKLINESNGSVITGEAGDQIGRGGRSLIYDWDEAAYTERQDSVLAALSENTDCCIRTSTPNGSDDPFARDYNSGSFQTFLFHWKSDPRKNGWILESTGETGNGDNAPNGAIYPWYENKKRTLPPITLAREIDVSFEGSKSGIVIPYAHVLAAVNYPLIMSDDVRVAGLDIATEGKDRSVFIIVDSGNKVTFIDSWQGANTTETAHRAIALCHQHHVSVLNFDVVGVGAGVSATLQTTPGLRFRYNPINVGSNPSDRYWQAEQRSSREKFYNLRAELYYLAAERFKNTWENVNGIAKHHTDDCISIPNDPRLIAQLPLTTAKYSENGKILLTPKKDMQISPDFADALILALSQPPGVSYKVTRATW